MLETGLSMAKVNRLNLNWGGKGGTSKKVEKVKKTAYKTFEASSHRLKKQQK